MNYSLLNKNTYLFHYEDSSSLPQQPEKESELETEELEKEFVREGFTVAQVSEILARMQDEAVLEGIAEEFRPNFKRIFTEPLISTAAKAQVDQNNIILYIDNQDMAKQEPNIKL